MMPLVNAWWRSLLRAWDEDLPLACLLVLWLLLVLVMWLPVALGALAKRIWNSWVSAFETLTDWNPRRKPWER